MTGDLARGATAGTTAGTTRGVTAGTTTGATATLTGALAAFADAGVLAPADVHVARTLARLGGEGDGAVVLAAALAVRAVRFGSVCVDLARVRELDPALPWPEPAAWVDAVRASGLVKVGTADAAPEEVRPLRFAGNLLYLERYWRQEQVVARWVDAAIAESPASGATSGTHAPGTQAASEGTARAEPSHVDAELTATLDRLFPAAEQDDLQRRAVEVATTHRFSIIAGGPGTGKTWTVARLLAALQSQAQSSAGTRLRVALAAPTGKAAARLAESIGAAAAEARFPAQDRAHVEGLTATTLHRLLGARPGTSRFTFDRSNRLPHDVVVVDEASMVSLTLMSRLMDALRPDCRLVLVGDPDQLASIEVGAVLGDLVARPGTPVVRLEVMHRFSETTDIPALAAAIRTGDPAKVDAAVRGRGIEFIPVDATRAGPARLAGVRDDVVAAGSAVVTAARKGNATEALARIRGHQVLCAHREGVYGVREWGRQAEAWLRRSVEGYGREG
ncbi:MAG: exodeoxyribonuclease V subunit alpha, partial [Actinobacteria bacterium]|nr:exodeoxyribonuclease V subunit alpha [Actinomycetota bacterium]